MRANRLVRSMSLFYWVRQRFARACTYDGRRDILMLCDELRARLPL
jgi:hypothetical protein